MPTPSSGAKRLYREVRSHLAACERDPRYLSETWATNLRQRQAAYGLADLESMLAPGSCVSALIDDPDFRIDASVLDLEDPIVRRILSRGEGGLGRPHRTVRVGRRLFSAAFVNHAVDAARLIRALDARDIRSPRIVEVGGGLGGLAAILRRYYGPRLTYYCVELPETLLLQEWYLRGSFPQVPWRYKAGRAPIETTAGGCHFINGYALKSQDFPFDAAVNVDSMQEMNRETIEMYLRWFERNISSRGVFYFRNHYGRSSSSFPEPSEYPLGRGWSLALGEAAPQIECCTESEEVRWIFRRDPEGAEPEALRLVLRVLWNGVVSGRVSGSAALADALSRAVRGPAAGAPKRLSAALKTRGFVLSAGEIALLRRRPYLAEGKKFLAKFAVRRAPAAGFTQNRLSEAVHVQSGVLRLMSEARTPEVSRRALKTWLMRAVPGPRVLAGSPFWSAYFAGMLLALGQGEDGEVLLTAAAARPGVPAEWLLRFSYLLARGGRAKSARGLMDRVARAGVDDPAGRVRAARIEVVSGRPEAARRWARRDELESAPAPVTAAPLIAALDDAWDDYFRLAGLGRKLQSLGLSQEADRTLARSLALRPGSSLHHEFVGDVYLAAGRWARAAKQFERALELRPYLRHVHAKRLHALLPAAVRDARVFGRPDDWKLAFPLKQQFYDEPLES